MASNSKYRPVLILGAAPRISVAVARSLHRHGIPVEVASFLATEPKLRSRAIRSFHRLPLKDLHRAKFLDSLLALVRERGFDTVLAAGDPALSALAEHYDQLFPLLHVGCPPPAIAEALDPALAEASLKLLRALEWEGPAMVEFRVDRETGNCIFMEVNGRYWGTSSLPILARVDFPLYHWQILRGEQPRVPGQYAIGMRWRWTPGYLDRLYSIMARSSGKIVCNTSRIRELVQIPIDFLPTIREALWSWSDPEPFFSELAASMYEHLTAAVSWLLRKLTRGRTSRYAKIYLRLRPEARSTYAKLRTADALGANRKYSQAIAGNMRSVLFVCYGNIMRSPMAEAMLKRVLAEQGVNGVSVQSAGLHALAGREAHPLALIVSREIGIPLDNHRAQLLTPEMVASSDVIFALDFENLAELCVAYPDAKN